ncbi:hypothetical protein Peur_070392 [Populus x canadensis]
MDKHGSQLGERGFLARRNPISMGATRCPFCSRFTESTSHLLLHCHCSWYFWSRVIQRISVWIQAIQESFTYTMYSLTKGS